VATCTLEVGQRLVLQSKGGPPEAEYALFDPGEIELLAEAPGLVREVGYRTIAREAIGRLESVGVNLALAHEAASAVAPSIGVTYARGPAVRRIAALLGPAELFDGGVYDAELRRYEGRWIDLPALALDVEISRATTLMQAFALVALLHEVDPQTAVVMTTRDYSAERRPGERSYRRVPLEHAVNLPQALRSLAARGRQTPSPDREKGPTSDELIAALEERTRACADPQAKERIAAIEAAMSLRQRPQRGPLSEPDLWLIEEQLSAGNALGVLERLDAIEKKTGRNPATSYLRARASLITGREPARLIAERAGALAMSMTSFAECTLLAAEAWNAAGEVRRAVPFARDLVSNPAAHDDIRARALQIVEAAERSGRVGSVPPPPEAQALKEKLSNRPPPPPTLPPPPIDSDPALITNAPPRSLSEELTLNVHNPRSYPPDHPARPPEAKLGTSPGGRKETPPMPLAGQLEPPPMPASIPPVLNVTVPASEPKKAPGTQTLPGPPPGSTPRQKASPLSFEEARGLPSSRRIRAAPSSSDATRAVAPPGENARATPVALGRQPSHPDVVVSRQPSVPPALGRQSSVPPGMGAARGMSSPPGSPRRGNWVVSDLMRGGSQPPFRVDSPRAHTSIPKAPKVPEGLESESAEMLALPPGLTGAPAPLESLPSSVLDARVQFTFLARELGREYREDFGIVLSTDLPSVEAMQAQLLERYPDRTIHSMEEALDVKKHGALLSEILARNFGAFWVDVAPADLGYWAMVVPPDTRVWPFGRVLRLIAMQHRERDLVAYYLELQSRAK
jgi:hypothetical protein